MCLGTAEFGLAGMGEGEEGAWRWKMSGRQPPTGLTSMSGSVGFLLRAMGATEGFGAGGWPL